MTSPRSSPSVSPAPTQGGGRRTLAVIVLAAVGVFLQAWSLLLLVLLVAQLLDLGTAVGFAL